MIDSNSTASMGIIGLIPLLVNVLLSQQTNGLSPDMSPWANLAAVGVIVGLFAWLLIYHIPSREKSTESRQDIRDARAEERMAKIQDQFLSALKMRDDTSRLNASSGHEALAKLIESHRAVSDGHRDVVAKLGEVVTQQRELCSRLERINKA